MTDVHPTELNIVENRYLIISWSDGRRRRYSFRELRDRCPCAACRENGDSEEQAPSLLPVLSAAEARPLRVETMRPAGNYGYKIAFSDGHRTGIYTFEYLRRLGEAVIVKKVVWLCCQSSALANCRLDPSRNDVGYGYIASEGEDQDIYFGYQAVEARPFEDVQVGQDVEYDRDPQLPMALSVRLVGEVLAPRRPRGDPVGR